MDEIVEVLNEYKDKGIIGKFGGSNWRLPRILQANEYAGKHGLTGFEVISPCFSLAELATDPWGGSISMARRENEDLRKWAEKKAVCVFPYSCLLYTSRSVTDILEWGRMG